MAGANGNTANQVLVHLTSKGLVPTDAWLASFLATQKPTTPLPALKQTALFRILASDITTTLQTTPGSTFPPDILDAEVKERILEGPIAVQVLDVEDIGRSKWSQIEAIEAAEKGETTKGREVVRVVPGEEGLNDPEAGSKGPHKLLLQDQRGTRVYGFEVVNVDGLSMNMNIGGKLILKKAAAARGVVLLEPESVTVAGGKIDALHKKWKEELKINLKSAIETSRAG